MSDPGPTTSTVPVNCFASRLPVPSRQRSSKTGYGRAKLVSFVLTSADHIAAVEAKDTPNRKGQKMRKAKNVTQPDKVKKGACQKKKEVPIGRPRRQKSGPRFHRRGVLLHILQRSLG